MWASMLPAADPRVLHALLLRQAFVLQPHRARMPCAVAPFLSGTVDEPARRYVAALVSPLSL